MEVMGIPQTLRLILPKMLALAISMPLIVLWTNAIALMGGMVSAQAELGIGTTNSVVTSITVVIIVDAIFAIMFKDIGIS